MGPAQLGPVQEEQLGGEGKKEVTSSGTGEEL